MMGDEIEDNAITCAVTIAILWAICLGCPRKCEKRDVSMPVDAMADYESPPFRMYPRQGWRHFDDGPDSEIL